jgi:hypothetical protein
MLFTTDLWPQSAAEKRDVLALTLHSEVELSSAACADWVVRILTDVEIPGGIIVSENCALQQTVSMSLRSGTTLQESLLLLAPRCTLEWAARQNVLNAWIGRRTAGPLDVNIEFFRWDLSQSVATSVQNLMSGKPVQTRIAQLHLVEQPKLGGPSIIGKRVPRTQAKHTITNLSLQDALNAVVKSYGSAGWLFTKRDCGDTHSYGFDVVVQDESRAQPPGSVESR